MSDLRLLAALRKFTSDKNIEKYLSTENRQNLKAIEDAFRRTYKKIASTNDDFQSELDGLNSSLQAQLAAINASLSSVSSDVDNHTSLFDGMVMKTAGGFVSSTSGSGAATTTSSTAVQIPNLSRSGVVGGNQYVHAVGLMSDGSGNPSFIGCFDSGGSPVYFSLQRRWDGGSWEEIGRYQYNANDSQLETTPPGGIFQLVTAPNTGPNYEYRAMYWRSGGSTAYCYYCRLYIARINLSLP
jgi:hypothetical protein